MNLNPLNLLKSRSKAVIAVVSGFALGLMAVYFAYAGMKRTSTNDYCESCHIHPQATQSWKMGAHYKNKSGIITDCIDCHLPPEGLDHFVEKGKAGARDLYGFYFKDPSEFDWDAISTLDFAVNYTFDVACVRCHQELFPIELTEKGVNAHLHYRKNPVEVKCVNCHLKTGHFHEGEDEMMVQMVEKDTRQREWAPLLSDLPEGSFSTYTEVIPGTDVKFELVPIPAGEFMIGSPQSEPGRRPDEGPQRQVMMSAFYMGRFEVSWREYDAYYAETATRGKNERGEMTDAITGPTPPYGSPDQGWGKGYRPAITMTHYAALKYCEWLSMRTGKKFRLPTEAEWEYAARAGTQTPFFFGGSEEESLVSGILAKFFGKGLIDPEIADPYIWYAGNSSMKTHPPDSKQPNPWGLLNMVGSVKEFCLDWYSPDAYNRYPSDQSVMDPRGPAQGEERVVRGGSYRSPLEELRSAAREHTMRAAWLKTDPQTPKSVWWYSDTREVGFRVVRELTDIEKAAIQKAAVTGLNARRQ